MAHGKKHAGIGLYVVVALILAVITYVEFYIVEWPPSFMTSGQVLFWLIIMSVAKFWMVIWYFMHLKDDDKLYTGFFSSGMVITMGTFVALTFLFLLPRAVAPTVEAASTRPAHGDSGYGAATLPADVVANIASDGASRSLAERAAHPRPADRSLVVTPPAAATNGFDVRLDAAAATATDAAAATTTDDGGMLAQATETVAFDRELGAQVYAANCAACHQANGAGIPGVFPPMAGHAADLYRAEGGVGGRTYLIDVMLYGLQGQIVVSGATYAGAMPAWRQLSDEQIAAVTNHIVAGFEGVVEPDGFEPIQPAEVAAQRAETLTPAQVLEQRQGLGDIPPGDAVDPEPAPAADAADAAPAEDAAPAATEAEPTPAVDAADADPTFDRGLAAEAYVASCAACHQATGAGIPGVFPPMAGHAADLYRAEGGVGGRTYLIDVLLYGLQGPITVGGTDYNGIMPAWAQLSDEQIALIINHTVAGFDGAEAPEGFDAIRPEEVAAQRGRELTRPQVLELRSELGLD